MNSGLSGGISVATASGLVHSVCPLASESGAGRAATPSEAPERWALGDCPGSIPAPTGTGIPQEPAPTEYSTRIITVTDCPPEVTDCPSHSTRTETTIDIIPTRSDDSPAIPTENPPYPTNGLPSTSVITYTTCVPTVTTSVVTLWPSQPPSGPTGGNPVPTGGIPTGGLPSGVPSGTGVPPQPSTTGPPPFEGAASTFGGSIVAAGLAAMVAVFFA
ncbi:predicted protein [Uncinocarpus reesii 1704]|uniref:Uncharacterized protein n=1 Tax=Uncinocarpus reesii (strain UAMH 1704) TaxID=336963 RepID=C4JKA5_UNCRE|nr:uncharacterized protein UREG_02062 [Uncinocarpus reesii 1704]EEP77213.1 predicted protein [Uncinocarpus reesii 1704]